MSVTVNSVESERKVTFEKAGNDFAYVIVNGTHTYLSQGDLREGLSTELDWTIFNDADLPEVRLLRGGEARYGVGCHELNAEHINTPEMMLEVAARWIALAKHVAATPPVDPAQLLTLSALIEDARPLLGKSSAEVASHLLNTRKITVNTDDKEN